MLSWLSVAAQSRLLDPLLVELWLLAPLIAQANLLKALRLSGWGLLRDWLHPQVRSSQEGVVLAEQGWLGLR